MSLCHRNIHDGIFHQNALGMPISGMKVAPRTGDIQRNPIASAHTQKETAKHENRDARKYMNILVEGEVIIVTPAIDKLPGCQAWL